MHELVGSRSVAARLCLPFELGYGRWTGVRERHALPGNASYYSVEANASWTVFSNCKVSSFSKPFQLAPRLRNRNASIVLVGDSRMRASYQTMLQLLEGKDETSIDPVEALQAHEVTRAACKKDLSNVTRTSGYKRRSICFGLCSCGNQAGGVDVSFVWATEWHSTVQQDRLSKVIFDTAGAADPAREVTVVISVGLEVAWKQQERGLLTVLQQVDGLLHFLGALPPNVHAIYQMAPHAQRFGPAPGQLYQDDFQAAQDGLIRALVSTTPASQRVPVVDVRMLTQQRVDCYDRNHCAGATQQVIIQAWMHLVLNWDELRSGSLREFDEANTREHWECHKTRGCEN